MADLHIPKECERDHGVRRPDEENAKEVMKVSDEKLAEIIERLYRTHTKSSSGEGCVEPVTAKDMISKQKVTREEVQDIIERLYKTHTKAMQDHPEEQTVAKDQISKQVVSPTTLEQIIERMYVTHTMSSKGGGKPPKVCDNSVARKVESPEEIEEIFQRLQKTHTKSSAGGVPCRPWDSINPPGYGLKMLPPIEGIEIRFAGAHQPSTDELKELDVRLMKTQTKASQARLDNPRILLYPERTTLCNNVERIRSFQSNGTVAKQAVLERREKWFN